MPSDFWDRLDELLASSPPVIDRPRGSEHPRYPGAIYPVDYGHLRGTRGGDGEGIDVWCGSGARTRVAAVLCTVDAHKRDAEIKLLVGCTADETRAIQEFLATGAMRALLVQREAPTRA